MAHLAQLRAAGLHIRLEGARPVVSGPADLRAIWRRYIIDHRAAIVAGLIGEENRPGDRGLAWRPDGPWCKCGRDLIVPDSITAGACAVCRAAPPFTSALREEA